MLPWVSWLGDLPGVLRDLPFLAFSTSLPSPYSLILWKSHSCIFFTGKCGAVEKDINMISLVSFSFLEMLVSTINLFFLREGLKSEAIVLPTASHPGPHFPGRTEVCQSLLSTVSAFIWARTVLRIVPVLGAAGSTSPDSAFSTVLVETFGLEL